MSHNIDQRIDTSCERMNPISLWVDGEIISAYEGETIAAVLTAAGIRITRYTRRTGSPRGVYCGMGVCFDCLILVEGRGFVRSCMTAVAPDMRISTTAVQEEVEPL